MKTIAGFLLLVLVTALAWGAPGDITPTTRAFTGYSSAGGKVRATTFGDTLKFTGNITTNPGTKTITIPTQTTVTGNAGTATALAATPAQCASGYSPRGIDVFGNASSCRQTATTGQTMYVGTTAHAINRASAAEALTGITGVTSSTELDLAAGGTNQNVVVTPTGTGSTLLNGFVGIGISPPTAPLHVVSNTGYVRFSNSTAFGIDIGEQVILGGKYNSAGDITTFGGLICRKSNATDGDLNGYCTVVTNTGGTNTIKIRWGEDGNTILTGSIRLGPDATACSSANRGATRYTAGGAGVADKIESCTKSAADVYAWRAIYTAP